MTIANVNSIDLYCEECGSGPPIIFQHGYTSSHEVWGGVIEKMCARNRCVAMDARGAGDSAHPENGYSIEQMAADIVGVADALDIDKFHYVGHSMGGVIGYELGLSHADRISMPRPGRRRPTASRRRGRSTTLCANVGRTRSGT